ncbi:MAG: hypothetical protein RL417_1518, partial [Pseudomonadota bacterium]
AFFMAVGTSSSVQTPVVASDEAVAKAWLSSPITLRGGALGAFGVYLLLGPVARETDIVAAVFAATILFLVITALTLTIASGARIRREFLPALSFPEGDEESPGDSGVYSGREVGCLLKVPPISIWPLYVLSVRLEFEEPGLNLSVHRMTGSFSGNSFLPQPITFPHRGRWRLRAIDCVFGDQFGLTQLRWQHTVPSLGGTITVRPPRPHGSVLPVITSCQRSGDLVTDLHDRRGDLFDLKPYHPADGMRRIVWKIFARRGELVSRQPEASMTPEGRAILYVLARSNEDLICGALLRYLQSLEDLGIEIFLGCEGMGSHPPARSVMLSERLLIEAVWNANRASPGSIEAEVEGLLGSVRGVLGTQTSLDRILVFCSAERLEWSTQSAFAVALGQNFQGKNIKPVFFIFEPADYSRSTGTSQYPLLKYFVSERDRTPAPTRQTATYKRFLAAASSAGWEVIRFGGES